MSFQELQRRASMVRIFGLVGEGTGRRAKSSLGLSYFLGGDRLRLGNSFFQEEVYERHKNSPRVAILVQ